MDNVKSVIDQAFATAIAHYDFVLQDLSGDIYNPVLQREKGPVIDFLKRMREEWVVCQLTARAQGIPLYSDKKEEP